LASILVSGLCLVAPRASAQLLSYDGFGNGPLPDLQGSAGGTGWVGSWSSGSTDVTKIQGAGLNYTGLATTPGGAVTPTAGGVWPSSIYARAFQALPPGTTKLYVSFLMRDDAAYGIWGGVSFGNYPYAMYVGSPQGYYSYGLMMSQGLGDITNKPLVQGQTTLVVVRITKNAGSGVTYNMYLDPAIGTNEPAFPAATYTLGPVNALPTSIKIDNGTGFTTDEIRVGTTWASVLPAAPNPWIDLGFAKPGSNGAPHLVGSGPLTANSTNSITLTNAKANTTATLILGLNVLNVPFMGGTLVPEPTIIVPLTTNGTGTVNLQSTWPAGIPAGTAVRFQYWIQDPAATLGLSASNGLQGTSS
jgi:hypothetical protein